MTRPHGVGSQAQDFESMMQLYLWNLNFNFLNCFEHFGYLSLQIPVKTPRLRGTSKVPWTNRQEDSNTFWSLGH